MATPKAKRFIDALHRLEASGEVDELVEQFAEEAELANPTVPRALHGKEGARSFWDTYRRSFKDIRSEFRMVIEADRGAVLEWTSRGHGPDGNPVEYDGVSVIEYDGQLIRRFKAYFDPRALGAQLERHVEAA